MKLTDQVRMLEKRVAELLKLVMNMRASGGAGEANTASNIGAGGVGLYDSKLGVDLRFRNINAGSAMVTVTLDNPNKEVDIDVSTAALLTALAHDLLSVTHGDTDPAAVQQGDIITGQGSSGTVWARLPLGTSGYILRSDGVDAFWDDISGAGGAPDDAWYIVGQADADLLNERVKQALYLNFDPDDYPAAPNAIDDEFDDGAIDVKWTIVNDPGLTEATYDGFLYSTPVNGVGSANVLNNFIRMYQALFAGTGTWFIAAKCAAASYTTGTAQYGGAGVYIMDPVPANKTMVGAAIQITSGDAAGRMNISGQMDNGAGAITAMTTTESTYLDQTDFFYIGLEKATANAYTSANTYNAWYSKNGIIWTRMGSCSKTFANVPTEVGLNSRKCDTAGNYYTFLVDWFRKLA